jgi:hypothetical protein
MHRLWALTSFWMLTAFALAAVAGCSSTPTTTPAPAPERPFAAEIDQFVRAEQTKHCRRRLAKFSSSALQASLSGKR